MAKSVSRDLLICPACRADRLDFYGNKFIKCQGCGEQYTFQNNSRFFFVAPPESGTSFLERLKENFKKYPRLYDLLVQVISPVCRTDYYNQKKIINDTLEDNSDAVILNLGSGSTDISAKVANVDMFPYKNVNIICNISKLPFKDNSVDLILNIAVLEHVPHSKKVVDEIYRVLKPEGRVYCIFPFIQGFHAAPYDFSRMSEAGLRILFDDFETVEIFPAGGPTSALLWILEEWLAMVFSFGWIPLYNVLHLLVMFFLWPLKFLDFFLVKHPKAKNIASCFAYIGRKKEF